jgi:hypothetical protein
MKLKYLLLLILLPALVSAINARSGLFKSKAQDRSSGKIYVSMAYPNRLDGVKAYDEATGDYVFGKLNKDNLWELELDTDHLYQLEVLYNSNQGSFNSLQFAGYTRQITTSEGTRWYRVTSQLSQFTNGSYYVLYSCRGTDCFE